MNLDHEALRSACFETARKTMEDARPTDVVKINRLADTFYSFSLEQVKNIRAQGRDPQMIVRAVNYLSRTHAIPAMHDSTEWFLFMLRALVELACPERKQIAETAAFLADIEEGITLVRMMKEERLSC